MLHLNLELNKCVCASVKEKPSDYTFPFQFKNFSKYLCLIPCFQIITEATRLLGCLLIMYISFRSSMGCSLLMEMTGRDILELELGCRGKEETWKENWESWNGEM